MHRLLTSSLSCLAAFGLQAATYYPVTIDYEPAATVANFPVLVKIPANSPIYEVAGTGGEALRFTDELGVNDYPHEVDTWNASGESLVWVRIPELKKGFTFRLYCSGTDTKEVKDLWTEYAGVWHLNEPLDSADKDYDPSDGVTHTTRFYTEEGATRGVSDAVIGKGLGSTAGTGAAFSSLVYDDRNGHKCPIAVSNPQRFTVSCWVRVQSVAGWTDLFGPVNQNGGQTGWKAEWTTADGKKMRMCQWGVNGERLNYFDTPTLASGWHKIDAIWDDNSLILYIDGALLGQKTNCPGVPTWFWTGRMGWGGCINANGTLADTGKASGTDFDECRIYDGVKSADRILADYDTVTDPVFLTIGPATEEQEIPPGTVAQVGSDYYQDFASAVAASKATGNYIGLMANGQSWTFTAEGESIDVKLNGLGFTTINGLGEDKYYVDAALDAVTQVTTYTLKKQIQIAAMRNVAVFKMLNTEDLYDLLPATVKGLGADGAVLPGDYAVAWDTEKVSKYGCAGITEVYGLATVGGKKLPVTAFVRAAVPYSDGYHNIAADMSSLSIKAPAVGDYPEITDPAEISNNPESEIPAITNGISEASVAGYWNNPLGFGNLVNHKSKDKNPYLDVDMGWAGKREFRRVEVFCTGGDNGSGPESVALFSNGEQLNYVLTEVNGNPPDRTRPWLGNAFNYCFDFQVPVTLDQLTIRLKQPVQTARGNAGNVTVCRLLIWETGTGIDSLEPSASAEITELEMDGVPVELKPGVTAYLVPHAQEVTLVKGEANIAPTIFPMSTDGTIFIVTSAEAGTPPLSMKYKIRTKSGFSLLVR